MVVDILSEKRVRMVACGEEHIGCLVAHGWVPDDEVKGCMACRKTFTAIRRRVSLLRYISITGRIIIICFVSITVVSVVEYSVVLVQQNDILY